MLCSRCTNFPTITTTSGMTLNTENWGCSQYLGTKMICISCQITFKKNTGLKIVPQIRTKTNDVQWDLSETVSKNINHYLIEFRENKDEFVDSDSDKIRPVLLEGAIEFAKRQTRVVLVITQTVLTIILLLLLVYLVFHKIPQAEFALVKEDSAVQHPVGMSV